MGSEEMTDRIEYKGYIISETPSEMMMMPYHNNRYTFMSLSGDSVSRGFSINSCKSQIDEILDQDKFHATGKVAVKALSDLPIPRRQTEGAGGYDLQSDINVAIEPMQRILVPTGYAFEIPIGKVGLIKDRSSMAYKQGVIARLVKIDGVDMTIAGVIDADYRGEVMILLINLGELTCHISKGDRIAQMVIVDHYSDELVLADELNDFDREGGFGSTGK